MTAFSRSSCLRCRRVHAAENTQAERVAFYGEDQPGTPTRIIASWTDTVLYQPNQVPMRGFGGRFIFYSGKNLSP